MKEKIYKRLFFLVTILITFFIFVTFSRAVSYKPFLVEKVFGYDKLLVTDNFSRYIISYGLGCSSFDFYEGQTIWIDTYFSPSSFDNIILNGIFDTKTCKIIDIQEVNIKRYFVVSVIDDKDEIIIEDEYGNKYLVEYGTGCGIGMWRYEGKYIDIDIGGSFLDGIDDRIYLFDSDEDCKVWDVQELSFNQFSGNLLLYFQCPPPNSTLIGDKCVCNKGYVAKNGICITYTQNCQLKYGPNSYGDENYCYCYPGYEFNSDTTACVPIALCPSNSRKIKNSCVCNEGFVMRNGKCITYTEDCQLSFGKNVIGLKGPDGNSLCRCKKGYVWNKTKTSCIKTLSKERFLK